MSASPACNTSSACCGSVIKPTAMVGGTEFFRVRVGPLTSVEQADQTLNYLLANGNGEARIVVE